MRFGSSVVLVLAPLMVVAACSSNKDDAASAFIQQYCSLLRPCCQPSMSGGQAGSGCVSFYSLFGGSGIDTTQTDPCLAEIRAHQNEMTFCSNVAALTPSCDKALSPTTGTKAPGEACSSSRDCAPSAEGKVDCQFGPTGQASICQLLIDGKAGDTPCIETKDGFLSNGVGSGPTVPRGFVCDLANNVWCSAKTMACEPTLKIGDACMFSDFESCGANGDCGSADKCVAKTPSTQAPSMDPSLLIVCSTMN